MQLELEAEPQAERIELQSSQADGSSDEPSQSQPEVGYIHFVGVSPEHRGGGLGRRLYERFFEDARAAGRTRVTCVTSPVNEGSVAFHEALGFTSERVAHDYDGPGEDRVLFVKTLA